MYASNLGSLRVYRLSLVVCRVLDDYVLAETVLFFLEDVAPAVAALFILLISLLGA